MLRWLRACIHQGKFRATTRFQAPQAAGKEYWDTHAQTWVAHAHKPSAIFVAPPKQQDSKRDGPGPCTYTAPENVPAPGVFTPGAPRFRDNSKFPDPNVGGRLGILHPERHPRADERLRTAEPPRGVGSPTNNRHGSRFVESVPRFQSTRPMTAAHVGPGTYDITNATAAQQLEEARHSAFLVARDGQRVRLHRGAVWCVTRVAAHTCCCVCVAAPSQPRRRCQSGPTASTRVAPPARTGGSPTVP